MGLGIRGGGRESFVRETILRFTSAFEQSGSLGAGKVDLVKETSD
jgi:hypothetical protein